MCPRSDEQFEEMRSEAIGKILKSAMVLFSQRGFHGSSMEAIAKEAGVSKGLAYNYFKSKDDILKAIIEKRLREVNHLLENLPKQLTPHETLDHLLRTLLGEVKNNIELYRLYFTVFLQPGVSPTILKLQKQIAPNPAALHKRITQIFRKLGFENPSLEAILFFSTIQGIAMDFLITPNTYPLEEMMDHVSKKYRGK